MSKNKDTPTDGAAQTSEKVHIVCIECTFSKVVTREGQKSAEVIMEHGRETGHKLTAKNPDELK